ncbi:MAG TPA: lipopolysaccharide biosynthesis protein [Sphingomonas sp.]
MTNETLMRRWFADGVFRTVLRNAGYLASSKLVGAALGLIALACAGHGLSPALFGVLMLIHSYANGAGALVKFQTWQFIVRHAAPALQREEQEAARDVVRFATGLDLASGLIGMAAAMAALPLLAPRFGMTGASFWLALGYCTLVPTMTAATPTGVLRVLDRFDLIAGQQIVTPALRAAGALLSLVGGFGFTGFVIAWYVGDLAGDLVLWVLAARELRRRDMLRALRPGLFATARRLPEAWSFVWTTNVAHSVYAAWGPLSNLLVGSMVGPAAAGLYKIASTFLDSAGKPADLLARGFYPEIMRLDPASPRPWHLAVRTGLLAGAIGLAVAAILFVGGKPLIALAFGHKYLAAFGLLKLMALSLVVSMASFPLESLLYMVGRQRAYLVSQLLAAGGYLLLLVLLVHLRGLPGAGIALLAGTMLSAILTFLPVWTSYRRHVRADGGAATVA